MGYSTKIVNRPLFAVGGTPRDTLLMENTSNNNVGKNKKQYSTSYSNIPVFSTPYSSEFSKIKNTVNKYLPIYSEILSKGIKSVSRRAPTLGNSLSPSSFSSQAQIGCTLKVTLNAALKDATIVASLKKGKNVSSCTKRKSFDILSFINCNTKFLVYLITCDAFHVQYMGRTTRRLKDRLHDHLYDIEKNRSTNVTKHWNLIHFNH